MRITVMAYSLSFLLVSVSVVVLCFTSRRSGGSEAAGPVLSQLESKINQLEDKFNSLSGRTCKDGKKGQDGDCGYICSKDHFLTYENNATRSGRVACCRNGEKVAPSGACQKEGVPDFCYRLKGRLVKYQLDGVRQEIFLRGFEGEDGDKIFKCDNDCCCTNSEGVLRSYPRIEDTEDDERAIIESFFKCGLSLDPSYFKRPPRLGLRDSCVAYRIRGPATAGFKGEGKLNFNLANPSYYYKGTLCELGQNC